ncbi:hypothetical protein [Mucilaginibacter ginsenosidivorans]|uniref:Uncharacterized protein n=1 Tax=Mucilaginibacter ginsenosidivorans TaxID=398053 RepID=A0A5B8UTV1_9SPHI|nr:hypothetical protein [Mucilaginibacter ginsenosidivorans]QEC61811.1 hypothetical protein FRZ54_04160 [Mucilaginibacter ginsenosidivorans]
MFTDIEQQTLDIDWFFTNYEDIGFSASAGGKLPGSVAKSAANQNLLSEFFDGLPKTTEAIINPELSKFITGGIGDNYLRCFVLMAQKGLFAYDKTITNNFSDPYYHLVAMPVNQLKFEELPVEVKEVLKYSKYTGAMNPVINIDLVQ